MWVALLAKLRPSRYMFASRQTTGLVLRCRIHLILAVFAVVPAQAQAQAQTISVLVNDLYTKAGLAGATVTLSQEDRELVRVSNANGRASFLVTVVGVETGPDGGFRLQSPFPNPSRGVSNIPMFLDRAGMLSVQVVDVLGRSVLSRVVDSSTGAQTLRVVLGGVAPGTYFVRISQNGAILGTSPVLLAESTPGPARVSLIGGRGPEIAQKTSGDLNAYELSVTLPGYMSRSFLVHAVASPNIVAWMTHSIINSVGMEMVRIPPGTFQMGAESGFSDDEQPAHEVTLTADFWIGRYEVTQFEYSAVTGESPSANTREQPLPVETVPWFDAVAFANGLSAREGLPSCYDPSGNVIGGDIYACRGYRLPTEAEWEYMARAGTDTIYFFGNDPARHGEYAWISRNSQSRTRLVGSRRANPWGLHDVYGNVYEWTHDWYDASYYSNSPQSNPPGPATGTVKSLRGGSWRQDFDHAESASREGFHPTTRRSSVGFRLARTTR